MYTNVNITIMAKVKTDIKVKLRSSIKNKVIHLRVPESVYKAVEDLAELNKCTTSEVTRAVLIEKLFDVNRINYESTE